MADAGFRAGVLRSLDATDGEVEELLAYGGPAFGAPPADAQWPLPDEPFAAVWDEYAAEAAERGAWTVLSERLVQ
ncbi:MAG TPA: hypothetical protein VFH27_15920, partial [Longimicrobiaceae bacterium]|nr:hypothetical protein [Longimicrobiaceae bacterium]